MIKLNHKYDKVFPVRFCRKIGLRKRTCAKILRKYLSKVIKRFAQKGRYTLGNSLVDLQAVSRESFKSPDSLKGVNAFRKSFVVSHCGILRRGFNTYFTPSKKIKEAVKEAHTKGVKYPINADL